MGDVGGLFIFFGLIAVAMAINNLAEAIKDYGRHIRNIKR